jgi:hypothetical protein
MLTFKNQKQVLFSCLFLFFTALLPAQNDGWVELINGRDFSEWQASEHKSTWSIADGLYQAYGKRSHLYYNGPELKNGFKNFEIDVTLRTFKLANSGIIFHTSYAEIGWARGMEIQVNNTHIGEGDFVELKKMASLYGHRNIYKSFAQDNEWINVKARVANNHVQVWLNGLKTVDHVHTGKLGQGTFALQGHDSLSRVQYKSFKVKRLPDDLPALQAPVLGTWADSIRKYQSQQYAFIDLNPQVQMSAADYSKYTYETGINTAQVLLPLAGKTIKFDEGHPLFYGLKVMTGNLKFLGNQSADYVVGESKNLKGADQLIRSGKIQIWAHTGPGLNTQNVGPLLDLAKKNNVAIEINNTAQTPSIEILKMAKAKGLKFTYSGLMPPALKLQGSGYVFKAIREVGITYKDLYIPKW